MPLIFKRRHRTKLIVPPTGDSVAKVAPSLDLPWVRTLGKAFYWERLIESGEAAIRQSWRARCRSWKRRLARHGRYQPASCAHQHLLVQSHIHDSLPLERPELVNQAFRDQRKREPERGNMPREHAPTTGAG
ncbi:MAG: hypothetical protein H0X13_10355 [Ramlibacter sp.]|nr:hypothetical protein [Ramlibacter sp.]